MRLLLTSILLSSLLFVGCAGNTSTAMKFVTFDTPPCPEGGMSALQDVAKCPADKGNGQVVLQLQITEKGSVEQITVLQSSDRAFNQPAKQAVASVKWTPALQNGKPVNAWITVPFKFDGESESASMESTSQQNI